MPAPLNHIGVFVHETGKRCLPGNMRPHGYGTDVPRQLMIPTTQYSVKIPTLWVPYGPPSSPRTLGRTTPHVPRTSLTPNRDCPRRLDTSH